LVDALVDFDWSRALSCGLDGTLVVPELRLLHLLQALIYVAVVILARRNNVYALGARLTIAVAWNSIETFGPHLTQAGALM
jgi:hypothetical protein